MNGTTEKPNGVISCPAIVSAPFGASQPKVLLFSTPRTISPSPRADSFGGLSSRGSNSICFRGTRMRISITTSPTKT